VLGNLFLGGLTGILGGYLGGWVDSVVSRIGDIFLGLPFVLGAIVLLSTFAGSGDITSGPRIMFLVIVSLVALGWPQYTRIMRSSVIAAKNQDYVVAARALGAGPMRIIFRHVLPNALGPLLVLATISLGLYIGAEATLSFLGVGLRDPVISWGVMVSEAQQILETAPHALLFPASFVGVAVLSFVMLGDAVRDAFDPKLR
jgi:oligopeptide transport system permease protein